MARYVVDVMPKREILDPQGKAVLGALPRLGFEGVRDVRQGKRFEIEVEGEDDDRQREEVRRMAEMLLANPVIEYFAVHAADPSPGPSADATADATAGATADPTADPTAMSAEVDT